MTSKDAPGQGTVGRRQFLQAAAPGPQRCLELPLLLPRRVGPEDNRKRAHTLYEAGIENRFFRDTNSRNDFKLLGLGTSPDNRGHLSSRISNLCASGSESGMKFASWYRATKCPYLKWRGNYCGFEVLMRSWISAASFSASATFSVAIFLHNQRSVGTLCPKTVL